MSRLIVISVRADLEDSVWTHGGFWVPEYAVFDYDAAPGTFKPALQLARCRRGTTPSASACHTAARDYVFTDCWKR